MSALGIMLLPELFNMSGSTTVGAANDEVRKYYEQHGFYVFRSVFDDETLEEIRNEIIRPALGDRLKYTQADAVQKVPALAEYVTDSRCVDSVERCIGEGAKFLQCADLQINHNVHGWHRDSASRELGGVDWDPELGPYTCSKAIIYVNSDAFGLEVVPGSHKFKLPRQALRDFKGETIVASPDDPNLPWFSFNESNWKPVVLGVKAGDVLVFDLRLYHRGHPLKKTNPDAVDVQEVGDPKRYTQNKATFSFCYGLDNFQSKRFHSYFRHHRRDAKYGPMDEQLASSLRSSGRLLSTWNQNFFDEDARAARDLFVSDNLKKLQKRERAAKYFKVKKPSKEEPKAGILKRVRRKVSRVLAKVRRF